METQIEELYKKLDMEFQIDPLDDEEESKVTEGKLNYSQIDKGINILSKYIMLRTFCENERLDLANHLLDGREDTGTLFPLYQKYQELIHENARLIDEISQLDAINVAIYESINSRLENKDQEPGKTKLPKACLGSDFEDIKQAFEKIMQRKFHQIKTFSEMKEKRINLSSLFNQAKKG